MTKAYNILIDSRINLINKMNVELGQTYDLRYKLIIMYQKNKEIESKVNRLREMQSYVILNRYFIRELESMGHDTRELKEEIKVLENKIHDLQIQLGSNF